MEVGLLDDKIAATCLAGAEWTGRVTADLLQRIQDRLVASFVLPACFLLNLACADVITVRLTVALLA